MSSRGQVLSFDDAQELRRLYIVEHYGVPELAHQFGVTARTVWEVIKYKTYRPENQSRSFCGLGVQITPSQAK